eukprot:TRINITY_DN8211_c0_g5_i1.p1 TRINITY_DN8211_c0_g5~~TRINITY_DN8211_c0_g5_i1.p1  ORF type:complete len:127 (-),score=8.04 TRINITY_DN8211_c0_g5_i1:911-1291(-)
MAFQDIWGFGCSCSCTGCRKRGSHTVAGVKAVNGLGCVRWEISSALIFSDFILIMLLGLIYQLMFSLGDLDFDCQSLQLSTMDSLPKKRKTPWINILVLFEDLAQDRSEWRNRIHAADPSIVGIRL